MSLTPQITPNQEKALFFAKRALSELVCDAVNLEGINYTLPEVQTLLDGVTVGGHKVSDEKITLNQAKAWQYLFELIASDLFSLSRETACKLHEIAAKEESLEWGGFRTGGVTIAGTDYMPPPADQLPSLWGQLCDDVNKISDVYLKSITLFLQMSRQQFFYDVNKRMGRFMMNGMLLTSGYPVINLPARRQKEFNELMLGFYASNDMQPMTDFMLSCIDQRIIDIMNEQ